MERIAVAGLSLHETDVAGLERLKRPSAAQVENFTRDLADTLGASELVFLATCNRIEVVYAREVGHEPCPADLDLVAAQLGLPAADELRARMHHRCGRDAAHHLFRVAASLDSVVVGEDQILVQVREAFARSERIGLSGRLLGTLFEHAFQLGKQVRTDTDLARRPVSVVSLGVAAITRRFQGAAPRIALVGAGQMAELFVRSARDVGLAIEVVANRSLERARALAATCGARALTLSDFAKANERVDVIVAATSAPGYVVERGALLEFASHTPLGRPLLAVDLAVPRDIEPVEHGSIEIVDLEQLRGIAAENRALRAASAAQAEVLVQRKLDALVNRASRHALDTALADLRDESTSVFEHELAQLFTGRLAQLDDEERRLVERWARTAFGRVTHVPISAIKRMAADMSLFTPPKGEESRS
jgi:glutamyl-tRNA reductase